MTGLPRALLATLLLVLLALLAAWQVPPRLAWGRYRAGIAEMAAARIGRHVKIAGDIQLSFIPQPVLTATNVTLADRGDGISANLGALRLQVAFWPLLAGHLVPRDLLLDDPVVTVPWPLPRVTPTGVHALPLGFGARVEGGTLRLSGFALENIEADMRADADTGAFAARGTARIAGRPVRFSTLIGAPGADGIATLAVSLDGQQDLLGTGGTLRGRLLADGALAGTVAARGADLSRLLPGPAVAWRAQGAVAAAGGTLHAPQLDVLLAQSPGTAGLTLHLTPTPSLQAGIHVGQVGLETWYRQPAAPRSALPMHLDLSADAATWRGTIFRVPHLVASLRADETIIEAASARLPAEGTLQFAGALHKRGEGVVFAGPVSLQAPDARTLLDAFLPALAAAWPAGAARALAVKADVHADGAEFLLANAQASVGGTKLAGSVGVSLTARPAVRVALSLDEAAVADWPPALPILLSAEQSATGLIAGIDLTLRLQAARVDLPGIALHRLVLDADADQARLSVHRLAAEIAGGHIEVAGTLRADGTVEDGKLDAIVPEAASLPAAWRVLPGLWHGPLHVAASAAGPPPQIGVQVRCDVNDLRAEAEGHVDLPAATLAAIATVRHPGAPRLLAALGVADAGGWIGQGSVALIAHVTARPGQVRAADFSLAAGALRASGAVQADTGGPNPIISGRIDAPFLTLPPLDADATTPLKLAWLGGWEGQFDLSAGTLVLGGVQIADTLSANVTLGAGALLAAGIAGHVAGGVLRGDAALDTTQPAWAIRGALIGADPGRLAAWPPLPLSGGTLDVAGSLTAAGFSPAAITASLAGEITGVAHAVALQGVDLARVAHLLASHAPHLRRALPVALGTGDTGPLTGDFGATLDNGAVTLAPSILRGPAGTVSVSGDLDLAGRMGDVGLQIRPAVAEPPMLGVRIAGPWQMLRRTADVAAGVAWAGRK